MDDFGTGYPSMETLKHMLFTGLKIDRIFAHGAAEDSDTRAILESSIKLGKVLGLNIVIEGIEIQADYKLAVELGCEKYRVISSHSLCRPMNLPDGWRIMKRQMMGINPNL